MDIQQFIDNLGSIWERGYFIEDDVAVFGETAVSWSRLEGTEKDDSGNLKLEMVHIPSEGVTEQHIQAIQQAGFQTNEFEDMLSITFPILNR
jgi:hypothetical protein